jgi:hypothetical protein
MADISENKNESANNLFDNRPDKYAIIVVDASGSTCCEFKNMSTIFQKMADVVLDLNIPVVRALFWNSPQEDSDKFNTGSYVIPYVLNSNNLKATFAMVAPSITGRCLTEPHLGVYAIPDEWLKNDPIIYILTDGNIGYGNINYSDKNSLERQFTESIQQLSQRRGSDGMLINPNPRVSIIAVEATVRDFNQVESFNSGAGGDMYKCIVANRLTNKIRRFISINPNGQFVQIDRNEARPGFIPYGGQEFHETKCYQFMQYIRNELHKPENSDEGKQLAIAQKLSNTLNVLTKDKPARLVDDIIRSYCNMFILDPEMVKFILTEAIQKERGGQAAVYSSYRAQLKGLFKQADGMLKQNVCSAVSLNDRFMTMLYVGNNVSNVSNVSSVDGNVSNVSNVSSVSNSYHILTGSSRLVEGSTTFSGMKYPNSAFRGIPVLPMLKESNKLTDLNRQCLRQWIRACYANRYHLNPTADEIIYLVLGDTYRVVNSVVSDSVKTGYKMLSMIMLEKKRLNSQMTEFDRLVAGELPIPNSGKIQDFYTYIKNVCSKLKLCIPCETNEEVMALWCEICKAVNNDLYVAQARHCPAKWNMNLTYTVVEDKVPDELSHEYTCLITLEDVSSVGGWKFRPHADLNGGMCSPAFVLSESGYQQLLVTNCICCICYKGLQESDFEHVGPKMQFDLPEVYKVDGSHTYTLVDGVSNLSIGSSEVNSNSITNNDPFNKQSNSTNNGNSTGKVVVLHGPVGSGKTTLAKKIYDRVTARGGKCFVEGPDKYVNLGISPRDACAKVTEVLRQALYSEEKDLVVVIDTCGERSLEKKGRTFFDVRFNNWERVDIWVNVNIKSLDNLQGYFAWSLRNVLLRGKPGPNDNFNLNPISGGTRLCIDIHHKKCSMLFPKKNEKALWTFSNATLDNLKSLSDSYVPYENDLSMI